MMNNPVIVIHGGAGNIQKDAIPKERREKYRTVMQEALDSGYVVLERGGTSVDAVEAAIHVMEDSPLFNAGKGSVYTHNEKNEMDASIMNGANKNAGSVAGVSTIKHPISAARMVMEESVHVMLAREGAEEFAEGKGLEIVDPEYFHNERRLEYLRKLKKRNKDTTELDHDEDQGNLERKGDRFDPGQKFGTVGAVALDKNGHLAAATSTGGMTNKKYARIGDSPIIGAGTYADDSTCAVSCTGHGEFFIRNVVAYDICAQMDYLGLSVEDAARSVIMEKLPRLGGTGGAICLAPNGEFAMMFNTSGMFRGYKKGSDSDIKMFQKE